MSVPLYPVSWWLVDEEAGEEAHTQVDTAQYQQQVRHPAQQLRVYEVPEYRLCFICCLEIYSQGLERKPCIRCHLPHSQEDTYGVNF